MGHPPSAPRSRAVSLLGVSLALATTLCAASTFADERPKARLIYSRAPEASACPDEETIRSGIASRLGYDPFEPDALLRVRAHVEAAETGLVAKIRSLAPDGSLQGERDLWSPSRDCAELAASLELAVAIAVDPLVLTHPAAEPSQQPMVHVPAALPPSTRVSSVELPPTSPDSRRSNPLEGSVGVASVFGTLPSPAVGGSLGFALHLGMLPISVGLELGGATLPTKQAVQGGQLHASWMGATLTPCMRLDSAGLCALASVGGLFSQGQGFNRSREATTPYAAAGGRAQFEFPSHSPLRVRLQADLLAPLTRTILLVGTHEVWKSARVSSSVGMLLVFGGVPAS